MTLLFVVVCIGVIAGVALVAAGRLDRLPEAPVDRRAPGGEPAFDVVARGYRMDEVDAVIEGLRAENARLRGATPGRPDPGGPSTG